MFDIIDFKEVIRIAEEQSVIGLVDAGVEYVKDYRVPQNYLLVFVGSALQIEQRNVEMNAFIANLVEKLYQRDISVLLLKGQGVAPCYVNHEESELLDRDGFYFEVKIPKNAWYTIK